MGCPSCSAPRGQAARLSLHRVCSALAGVMLCVALAGGVGGQAQAEIPSTLYPQAPTRTSEDRITVGSIPLTIAPGWKKIQSPNCKSAEKCAFLVSKEDRLGFSLQQKSVKPGTSVEDVLSDEYSLLTRNATDAEGGIPYNPGFVGERFNESSAQDYRRQVQTHRGTQMQLGTLVVLLNSGTGDVGVVRFWGKNPDIVAKGAPGAAAMIDSTLN